MPLNNRIRDLRVSKETMDLLIEASENLNLPKSFLARLLLTKGLKELKTAQVQAGSWTKLNLSIKQI